MECWPLEHLLNMWNKTRVYERAQNIAEDVFEQINRWNTFQKDTVGKQLLRSVDSIAANIAEGLGRETQKEQIRFLHIARASAQESITWLEKCEKRKWIKPTATKEIIADLEIVCRMINSMIRYKKSR